MIQFCFISKDHDKMINLHINILKRLIDNDEDISKYITESFAEQEQDIVKILSNGKMSFFSVDPVKDIDTKLGDTELKGYVLVISYNSIITKISNIIQIIIDTDEDKIHVAASDNVDISNEAQSNMDLMNKYLDFKKAYEKRVGNMSTTEQALAKLFGGLI